MILNIQNSNTICFISNFNNVQEVPKQLARFQTPEREKHLDFPQNAFLEAWIHEQFEKKYMSCGIFKQLLPVIGRCIPNLCVSYEYRVYKMHF